MKGFALNPRPAPLQLALAVKRRLEKANPGANLSTDAVKLVALPGVPFDATIFCFEQAGKIVLVAELCKPDLPHIYKAVECDPTDKKQNAIAMLKAVAAVAHTVRTDRRFQRNIITLNGRHSGLLLPRGGGLR